MGEDLNKLVKLLQEGNLTVFDEIYHQTYRSVFFSVLPILKDESLTEDIIQDTYMKMLENIQKYKEKNFFAYLITIARNTAINEYNKRKKTTYTDDNIDLFVTYPLINHLEISLENEQIIKDSLSVLDEVEKNVFLLYNVENMTHKEISSVFNKPIGTITWIYAKAIKKIRKHLKEAEDEI
ncbi:MAG: sigma-70 family RNA polymerase sigma factor [Firmicutes bacterium]|nr:sigma-70 family RNA polymerase sigma factor [Bacillota bacterium]